MLEDHDEQRHNLLASLVMVDDDNTLGLGFDEIEDVAQHPRVDSPDAKGHVRFDCHSTTLSRLATGPKQCQYGIHGFDRLHHLEALDSVRGVKVLEVLDNEGPLQ